MENLPANFVLPGLIKGFSFSATDDVWLSDSGVSSQDTMSTDFLGLSAGLVRVSFDVEDDLFLLGSGVS